MIAISISHNVKRMDQICKQKEESKQEESLPKISRIITSKSVIYLEAILGNKLMCYYQKYYVTLSTV